MKLSEHFDSIEFECNCSFEDCPKLPEGGMAPKLIEVLEEVREHFGKPLVINSGFRCVKYNDLPKKKGGVGGAQSSQHKVGTAADIHINGVKPKEVYDFLASILLKTGGLGKYNSFTHVDVRRNKARWRG